MDDTLPAVGRLSPAFLDLLIVAGAIGVVLLGIAIWAFLLFLRESEKPPKKRKRHHSRISYREWFKKNANGIKELLREHQRRPRREQRPTNPTLSQTDGPPPIREEKKSEGTTQPP